MKTLIKSFTFIFILLFAFACETDEDKFYDLGYVQAPANVNAVFDITQDNTGLVTILPNSEGATKYMINFGDGATAELGMLDPATHNYKEGVYQVEISAMGITGLTAKTTKELNITFKAPENLEITISKDAVNPKIVSVTATADFAAVMDVYFGDVEGEEPIHVLPGEAAVHTYTEPGDYIVRVVAKSGGVATTEDTKTVTIDAASDPIYLPVNFESFTVNYAFIDFGSAISSVIDNPDASGINTSARVGQSIKSAGAETWAGTVLTLGDPIDFSAKEIFKVKVWSPKAGSVVKLKVENLDNADVSFEVDAVSSVQNGWEELTFDFSAIDKNNDYQKLILFFDFGNVGDGATYFFDDIKLQFAEAPSTSPVEDFEGEAPVFTEFGNAFVEVIANPDPSGVNTTANVAQLTKASGSEVWAGAFFEVTPLDLDSYSNIKVKTWSPKSGIVIKLKIENADASIVHEVDITNTKANAWEDLSYDFSDAPKADYEKVVMFFDFGNAGDGSIYYYDEIELENEGGSVVTMPFQDFEGEAPAFTEFGNAFVEVISNPDQSGVNTTANVVQLTKASGSEVWAGAFFEVDPLDLDSFSKISVKTWSPKSGIVIKLKLENADASIVHEVDITNTKANAWEDLSYDFSEAPAADYVKVVMFFDFGNVGDDSVYYYDEFVLTN